MIHGQQKKKQLIVVTGMSGAGKATVLHALEDAGFFSIDNLPFVLFDDCVKQLAAGTLPSDRLAVTMDVRDKETSAAGGRIVQRIKDGSLEGTIIFLDADDEVLLRRFSQMRRSHPLGRESALSEAVAEERRLLTELKQQADIAIDSSLLSPHQLKQKVRELFLPDGAAAAAMPVTISSFGFKNGAPTDVDMVLDVRFLANPYFVPELKELTGRQHQVATYVLDNDTAAAFFQHLLPFLVYLVPEYRAEGKAYFTLGIGCTGGKHRSVAVAEEIARRLGKEGIIARVRHRDLGLE